MNSTTKSVALPGDMTMGSAKRFLELIAAKYPPPDKYHRPLLDLADGVLCLSVYADERWVPLRFDGPEDMNRSADDLVGDVVAFITLASGFRESLTSEVA